MSGRLFTIEHPAFAGGDRGAHTAAPRVVLAAVRPVRPSPQLQGLRSKPQRLLLLAVVLAHMAGLWALLQITEVRKAVAQVAPMVVRLIASPAPRELPTTAPPPPSLLPPPPLVRLAPPELTLITPMSTPTPTTAPSVVTAPSTESPPSPAAPTATIAVPAPAAPAPPPAPKILPASAVQYLGDPPVPEYPRLSIRHGETGRVMLRIYIDEAGLPRSIELERSSGHPRLDDAAIAAIRKARFKPYTESGKAVAGWAFVPLDFSLQK